MTLKTYKCFDKEMKCRGFQYEVGQTYSHEGNVVICEDGFHSCENPLDCLNYYALQDSRFATVLAHGDIKKHDTDSKVASAKITIEAELKLTDFIKASVDYLIKLCNTKKSTDSSQLAASGNGCQLAASGDSSQLAASGCYSKLAASGDSSIAVCAAPNCKAKVGKNGTIVLSRWVEEEKRYRVSVGYVDENIKEDTWYMLNNLGEFVEVTPWQIEK